MDAYICDALRTPFGRYGGALSTVRTDDLAAWPIKALMARHPSVDWGAVDDVVFGCANQAGEDNRNVARMALLLAGLPQEVPGSTVNRLCGSSLDAIAIAARAIAAGEAELIVAGGVEGMTRAPFVMGKADSAVLAQCGTRRHHDGLALRQSGDAGPLRRGHHARDGRARRRGAWDRPGGSGCLRLPQSAARRRGLACGLLRERDRGGDDHRQEGRRRSRSRRTSTRVPRRPSRAWPRLGPIVRAGGTVTAGNASGVNDGAAALLIASEAAAARHGLTPLARIVSSAVAGVAPRVMGIGPVPATRKVLARTGLTLADVDVIELNEAFAAQALAVAARARAAGRRRTCEPERRRDRDRPSARRERRPPGHDRALSTPPHRRPLRAVHDVHRRRAGDCHGDRAGMT